MESSLSRKKTRSNTTTARAKIKELPPSVMTRLNTASQTLILPQDIEQQVKQVGERLQSGQARALFFGAPGLGKSATVINLQANVKRPFWWVLADQFAVALNALGGFSFRDLFLRAREANAVLVFDDFDCFIRRREEKNDSAAMRTAIASWLAAVDEFAGEVGVLATTNLPQIFEPAILRRFEHILHFKRLGDDELRRLMAMQFGEVELPGSLINELRSIAPSEIVDIARITKAAAYPLEAFEEQLQQRLRVLKIAGVTL